MKTLLTSTLGSWALLLSPGCAIAQELVMPAVPITVEALVRDPEGRPIEGATVHLALPRYRDGDRDQKSEAKTDKEGKAIISGIAQQDYILAAERGGYYFTQGPHRGINSESGLRQYATGVQKIDLELRPIRNPIKGIRRGVDRWPLPNTDGPMGFDLEVGDWVAPHGKGRSADFIFELDGRFTSSRDYDQKFTLQFSRPQDGITVFKHPKKIGSALKWPYEAPLSGYESSRTWLLKWNLKEGGRGTTIDRGEETNYLFRVRSEVDEKGNVVRAMYGVVSGDFIPVGGNNEIGRKISFMYALNPDWTRNLEFDPAETASSPMIELGRRLVDVQERSGH
jgi:hypothetical protein